MANARIEEVSDSDSGASISDPDEMDVDAFDFARPKGALQPDPSQLPPEVLQQLMPPQTQQQGVPSPSPIPPGSRELSSQEREAMTRSYRERTKSYQCLYPVYFDASRSREQGRRVSKALAVPNPLAREIVDALQQIGIDLQIGLQVVFEPTKTHPKDWANPGRVRVQLKDPKQDGVALYADVLGGKHHLYRLVGEYLRAHPTTEESPLKYRIQGMPAPKGGAVEGCIKPAVPRGWKMGTILPLHSPALSGGGVSENFLKDMMGEMGGQLPPGMEGLANMANMAGGGAGGGKQKVKVQRVKR